MATTTQRLIGRRATVGFDMDLMTPWHWALGALSTVTSAIHVYLYLEQGFVPFLFAGIVFLAAVAAMLFNVYRRALYAIGIPFTAGQVVLWYVQGMPDMSIAVIDKPVQILLIVLLAYLFTVENDVQRRKTDAVPEATQTVE